MVVWEVFDVEHDDEIDLFCEYCSGFYIDLGAGQEERERTFEYPFQQIDSVTFTFDKEIHIGADAGLVEDFVPDL